MISSLSQISTKELFTGGHAACAGCPAALCAKLITKALGEDTVIVNGSGCMTLLVVYPLTPFKIPWIHNAIENVAATASGISRIFRRQGKKTQVVCHAGDGASYDIGLQSLSGMLERRDDVLYVCYNNQSFANTGVQRSSATPWGTMTKTTPVGRKEKIGKELMRKPLAKIVAAHDIPYVATASAGYPLDFIKKLQKASEIKGPKFIEYFSPCVPGWGIPSEKALEIGRIAVQAGVWPMFEIENGNFKLTFRLKELKPVGEYLKMQKRYRHLRDEDIEKIQGYINKEWELLMQGKFWEAKEY